MTKKRIALYCLIWAVMVGLWIVIAIRDSQSETKPAQSQIVTSSVTTPVVLERSKKPSRDTDRKPVFSCKNDLAHTLYKAGFRGENIREAWAIAMRESGGQERNVTNQDYGLFQFNYPTWNKRLDYSRILDGDYNAAQAFRISNGGRTWAHWGLTGSGETDPSLYGMWSDSQVYAWITEPYQRYYKQYPCGGES